MTRSDLENTSSLETSEANSEYASVRETGARTCTFFYEYFYSEVFDFLGYLGHQSHAVVGMFIQYAKDHITRIGDHL